MKKSPEQVKRFFLCYFNYFLYTSRLSVKISAPGGKVFHKLGLYSINTDAHPIIFCLLSLIGLLLTLNQLFN